MPGTCQTRSPHTKGKLEERWIRAVKRRCQDLLLLLLLRKKQGIPPARNRIMDDNVVIPRTFLLLVSNKLSYLALEMFAMYITCMSSCRTRHYVRNTMRRIDPPSRVPSSAEARFTEIIKMESEKQNLHPSSFDDNNKYF